jgi:putative nucleotidyltransferase with HDIG domain
MLTQMRQFDASLFTHAVDTCVISLVVGKEQGLDTEHLAMLGMGALLHDIGQMRLPRNLLRKADVYAGQDQKLLQKHPELGATLLSQSTQIPAKVGRIVAEHHERIDGSGYPAGLSSTGLSLFGQIVGLANAYTDLLSGRGGRAPLPSAQTLRQLYQFGTAGQFDLALVERIVRSLGIYPVGTLVELNTKERGVVIAANPADALRPTVKLLWNSVGSPAAEPLILDLSTPTADEPERAILRTLDAAREEMNLTICFE